MRLDDVNGQHARNHVNMVNVCQIIFVNVMTVGLDDFVIKVKTNIFVCVGLVDLYLNHV